MKLAFCLYNYFPFGGLQRDFLRIAKECLRRGHQVDVYTMHWQGDRDPQLPVTEINATGWQNHTRAQNFVAKLQPYLQKQHYDLVVGFNKMPGLDVYYAADTCYQAKARQQHGAWYRLTPRYRHLIEYENAVFAAEAKTKILLIAKSQQSEFQHFYHTPAERFSILPPGIAKDRKAPPNAKEIRNKLRDELHITAQQFLLLMVGSGFKTKGLDRTINALGALPAHLKNRTQLFIIGQDHPEKFQKQAEKLAVAQQIHFLGGRNDVPNFLLAADLLLHPAYNENTGTVLLEALVAGLPVVTTDVCGYAHYVQEAKAGLVLPSPFDQSSFNQVLADVLSSLPREDWQQNALQFAEQADIYSLPERAANELEKFAVGKFK